MKIKLLTVGLLALSFAATACAQNGQASKNEGQMKVIHLNKDSFLEKVYNYEKNPDTWKFEGSRPAIVDFFATWCGPCKALGPVLEELAEEYAGKVDIYKIDVDQEQELAGAFGIRSVPTLLIIPTEGQPAMSAGAPTKAQLKEVIEKML
ncbi:MAG TPA: thioredoxin [Candidatus Coprenecus stercoripullorum]|nr:thioredoxin [Candidatus Coprenecus stercoripullorum]